MRNALVAIAVTAGIACGGGTHLEGDAPDARDADTSAPDDGDAAPEGEAEAEIDAGDDARREDGDSGMEADACVPSCEGHECGDDGCGGTCGPGCAVDEVCRMPPGECAPGHGWVEVPPAAPPDGLLAFDAARRFVVLLGRRGDRIETWEYDGARWTRVEAAGPSADYFVGLMYDSARGAVVLLGCDWGTGEGDLFGVWAFDGASWTRDGTSVALPDFGAQQVVYDSARRVLVAVGTTLPGDDPAELVTWEYDGVEWTRVMTPTVPPTRSYFAMAYDSGRGVTVLFGGEDTGPAYLADTWEYDGTTWTPRYPATPPPARWAHGMTFDSTRGVVVLVGGHATGADVERETWEYDGAAWRRTAADGPKDPAMGLAFDAARGVVLQYRGPDGSGETWEYDGVAWTRAAGPSFPPSLGDAMAVHEARRTVMLAGATRGIDGSYVGGTWEYDGGAWREAGGTRSTPTWRSYAMAWDRARGTSVLFGGCSVEAGFGSECSPASTWEYGGSGWTEALGSLAPPGREYAAMACDAANGVVVLFGGTVCPEGEACISVNDTWEFDGGWRDVSPAVRPRARAAAAMAWDSTRGVLVMFGGGGGAVPRVGGLMDDTWTFGGIHWSELETPVSPTARQGHVMVEDPIRGLVVLFGGWGATELHDTWELDGSSWTRIGTSVSPPATGPLAYDIARGVVVMYLGTLGETWEYHGP